MSVGPGPETFVQPALCPACLARLVGMAETCAAECEGFVLFCHCSHVPLWSALGGVGAHFASMDGRELSAFAVYAGGLDAVEADREFWRARCGPRVAVH